jgi:hypothetical protein
MTAPPFLIYQNVNNFRLDCTIWLQFELHIPKHNRNWKISSKMRNFEYPRCGVDVLQKLQILMQKTQ